MDDLIKAFSKAYNEDSSQELIRKGEKLKKQDRANDKRLKVISVSSVIAVTLVGFMAFGLMGSIIFFMIGVISSFFLTFSSKKNLLINYINFYRYLVPKIIGDSLNIKVEKKEVPDPFVISSLFSDCKLNWRICHKYDELYMGYAKFMKKGDEPVTHGVVFYAPANIPDICVQSGEETEVQSPYIRDFLEKISEEFSSYTLKAEKGNAVLYLPFRDDYLPGRIEMTDDLSLPSLVRQFDYYLLLKAFSKIVMGEKVLIKEIWHEV
ncbi:MAG: hypothetical protein E7582_07550 [Ruminococcaceae bacterium]|nr:hypothetical protein [Oscillospiraceae bacterium]